MLFQDGGQQNFRPVPHEVNFSSNYRSPSSNYRMGPGGAMFRPEGPGQAPDICWRKDGFTQRLPSPVARPQANWEGNDPRFHSQRRIPDSNPRKPFISPEERYCMITSYVIIEGN